MSSAASKVAGPRLLGSSTPDSCGGRALRRLRARLRESCDTTTDGPISRPNTRSARVITGPRDSAAARSTTLRSSRTLPGQRVADAAPPSRPGDHDIVMPRRAATSRRKWFASAGMSSRRSRSGGSSTWTTVSRKYEILAERAAVDLFAQVAVGRRDHADVDLVRAVAADALDLALLEHAQQLGLQRDVELADLVEEDRAAVGLLEAADVLRDGAGERALLVTEQLDSISSRGIAPQSSTTNGLFLRVDRVVERARDHLLAGAGLAGDEHVSSLGATFSRCAKISRIAGDAPSIVSKRSFFDSSISTTSCSRLELDVRVADAEHGARPQVRPRGRAGRRRRCRCASSRSRRR